MLLLLLPEDWHRVGDALPVCFDQDVAFIVPSGADEKEAAGEDAGPIGVVDGLRPELALHAELVERHALLKRRQIHDGDQEVTRLEQRSQPVGPGNNIIKIVSVVGADLLRL